jgi:hypothetical protein
LDPIAIGDAEPSLAAPDDGLRHRIAWHRQRNRDRSPRELSSTEQANGGHVFPVDHGPGHESSQ